MTERTDRFEDSDDEIICASCGAIVVSEESLIECHCCGTEFCEHCQPDAVCPDCGMEH